MSNSEDGQGKILPAELASAFQRTTAQTLAALHSLRVALRDHVHSERSRGASLAEIDGGLREMIVSAGDGDGDGQGHSPERISELTTQILKWCESFYSPRR
jgi:hypothetical protein